MPREIIVELGGQISSFGFKKVDRSKLYGTRRRIPLDPDGDPCARGELLADGSLLLRPGMTAQAYFDDEGTWYPLKALSSLWPDGSAAEKLPSTLGEEQPLQSADPEDIADTRIHSVYALDPVALDATLREQLVVGELFQFAFSYRGGARQDLGYLLANTEGFFALVGQPTTPQWCDLAAVAEDNFGEDDGFDDELDFEMF